MYSDRELLEQAAKAYFGAGNFEWNSCAGFAGCVQYIPPGGRGYLDWNPKDDDGDSLRLAVKLGLKVRWHNVLHQALVWTACDASEIQENGEAHSDDSFAATRHAILRAAAETGRAMS